MFLKTHSLIASARAPPARQLAEQVPRDRRQAVDLAVPAAEQVRQRAQRQFAGRVLWRLDRRLGLGLVGVVEDRLVARRAAARRGDDAAAAVAEGVGEGFDPNLRLDEEPLRPVEARDLGVDVEHQQDRRRRAGSSKCMSNPIRSAAGGRRRSAAAGAGRGHQQRKRQRQISIHGVSLGNILTHATRSLDRPLSDRLVEKTPRPITSRPTPRPRPAREVTHRPPARPVR